MELFFVAILLGSFGWMVMAEEVSVTHNPARIFHGFTAEEGQFPYQLRLTDSSSKVVFCGAAIISPRYALTAAHCLPPYPEGGELNLNVTLTLPLLLMGDGVQLTQLRFNRTVIDYKVHPLYKGPSYNDLYNDIGLLEVAEPFPISATSQQVPLVDDLCVFPSVQAIVSGWGKDSALQTPQTLQYANVSVVAPSQKCDHGTPDPHRRHLVICAIGEMAEDAAKGDSGGPLVMLGVQIGVVSVGVPDPQSYPAIPGVYTAVSEYKSWILNHTTLAPPKFLCPSRDILSGE